VEKLATARLEQSAMSVCLGIKKGEKPGKKKPPAEASGSFQEKNP
jgi:hypothetical protein